MKKLEALIFLVNEHILGRGIQGGSRKSWIFHYHFHNHGSFIASAVGNTEVSYTLRAAFIIRYLFWKKIFYGTDAQLHVVVENWEGHLEPVTLRLSFC